VDSVDNLSTAKKAGDKLGIKGSRLWINNRVMGIIEPSFKEVTPPCG